MNFGLIMPVCTHHAMQQEAWTLARTHSRADTAFIVLFNGCEPMPVPEGTEAISVPRFTDEQDLWQWGLNLAVERGWDWTMFIHDDFAMREPGWEADIEQSDGWRVAVASWCVYTEWDEPGGSYPTPHHLGVTIDSFSFGFRTDVFKARGCVTAMRFGFGFAAWDTCAWALDNGYGIWRIVLNSDHQWMPDNSRAIQHVGAPGHPEVTLAWKDRIMPARTPDASHIMVAGRMFRIAPQGWTPTPIDRTTTTGINPGNVFKLEHGESRHYRNGEDLGPFRT